MNKSKETEKRKNLEREGGSASFLAIYQQEELSEEKLKINTEDQNIDRCGAWIQVKYFILLIMQIHWGKNPYGLMEQ